MIFMQKYSNPIFGTLKGLSYKEYHKLHRRIARRVDYFFPNVMNPEDILSLDEIRNLLSEETGVVFRKSSIKKCNDEYTKKYGSGPLCRFKDKYMINPIFYKMKKIKPPKGYPK